MQLLGLCCLALSAYLLGRWSHKEKTVPDTINWEAMEVALGQLRVECMVGRKDLAKSELIYIMSNLSRLMKDIERWKDVDDETLSVVREAARKAQV